jgi:hypothetical protein
MGKELAMVENSRDVASRLGDDENMPSLSMIPWVARSAWRLA